MNAANDTRSFTDFRVADLALAQCRDFVCVWDNPNGERLIAHGCDSQTDAVHRNGAFLNDLPKQLGRRGYFQHVIGARTFPTRYSTEPIDVARDEMSIEAAIGAQWAFQIYERTAR